MNRLPNIHPGEVLQEEFLKPMGISQYALAKAIHVPAMRIHEICHGKRRITQIQLSVYQNSLVLHPVSG